MKNTVRIQRVENKKTALNIKVSSVCHTELNGAVLKCVYCLKLKEDQCVNVFSIFDKNVQFV